MQDHNAPPLNPLPWVVWLIALPMIAMEVVMAASTTGLVGGPQAVGWRLQAVTELAFPPDMLRQMVELSEYGPQYMYRLFSYPFIHGSTTHAVFTIVMLLALGKSVATVFRWWAVLFVFFGSAAVGAATYTFALPSIQNPLFGSYPPVYGLIGAFTFLLWVGLAAVGANKLRAFGLIGFLLAVQMLFGIFFGGTWEWVADLSAFTFGFLVSFVVSPGGFSRVLAQIRDR